MKWEHVLKNSSCILDGLRSRYEMSLAEVTLKIGLSDLANKNTGDAVKFEVQTHNV